MVLTAQSYDNLNDRQGNAVPQHQKADGTGPELTRGSDYADWSAPRASAAAPVFQAVNFDALSNTVRDIKATAGKLGGWDVENPGNATLYLQFFCKPAASVLLGADVPYMVVPIPPASTDPRPPSMPGWDFYTGGASGISVAATGSRSGSDAPDADAGATFYNV